MFDNTTWAFVGLVLFLALLGYLGVFGMMLKALDKRGERVADELAEAKKLREEAQALLVEYQAKRAAAEKDAAEIIASAQHEAERLTEDAKIALAELIERRTKSVEAKIAQAEAAAISEVRTIAVDVAVAAAGQLMTQKVQGDLAADLVAKGIGEVKSRLN
ncbi:F0F1 ATP synthase subunit B family protein [Oryzibacter oryziterrae]|uniref:F0F1 ATP synthase subunit B family protein n=1 Tax=Oryzibacter oryziterrae TaxID=2766474 RepID=UPI001F3A5FAC|nr:ATP F0F1 synthase subunit B [Oryzibacter oryziterrae]